MLLTTPVRGPRTLPHALVDHSPHLGPRAARSAARPAHRVHDRRLAAHPLPGRRPRVDVPRPRVPPDFAEQLAHGKPELHVLTREGDDRSRIVIARVNGILDKWKARLKETRLRRANLPPDYDQPFKLHEADSGKSTQSKAKDELS